VKNRYIKLEKFAIEYAQKVEVEVIIMDSGVRVC